AVVAARQCGVLRVAVTTARREHQCQCDAARCEDRGTHGSPLSRFGLSCLVRFDAKPWTRVPWLTSQGVNTPVFRARNGVAGPGGTRSLEPAREVIRKRARR